MVFDDQAKRALRHQVFQPQQQGIDHLASDFFWRLRLSGGCRVLAEQHLKPRDDVLPPRPSAQPELQPAANGIGLIGFTQAEPASQQVDHRPERAVCCFRAAGQGSHAVAQGLYARLEFPHQPGFTYTGLTRDQQRGELALRCLRPGGLQQREFALAADPWGIVCLTAKLPVAARLTQQSERHFWLGKPLGYVG